MGAKPGEDQRARARRDAAGSRAALGIATFWLFFLAFDRWPRPPPDAAALKAWDDAGTPQYWPSRKCPAAPRPPHTHPLSKALERWPVDDAKRRAPLASLCRFDYLKERRVAARYRDAGIPFQLYNIPDVDAAVYKWSDARHLDATMGAGRYHTAGAATNHFLYASKPFPKGYVAPTSDYFFTFREWLKWVTRAPADVTAPDSRRYLLFNAARSAPQPLVHTILQGAIDRLQTLALALLHGGYTVDVTSANDNTWIFDDLPLFDAARRGNGTFVHSDPAIFRQPKESWERGVFCRFGMAGIVTEMHWDYGINFLAQLKGSRRWLIADPSQACGVRLFNLSHPSRAHTSVDWTDPTKWPEGFGDVRVSEVVQDPGDVLYVPSLHLHMLVQLESPNAQCNTRAGRDLRRLRQEPWGAKCFRDTQIPDYIYRGGQEPVRGRRGRIKRGQPAGGGSPQAR